MKITDEIRQAATRTANNNGILRAYRDQKQFEAEARQEAREKRSPLQQLEVLDICLGKGKGAEKERSRLVEQITKAGARKKVIEKATAKKRKKGYDLQRKPKN